MKKFILPAIVLIFSILLIPLFFYTANAQESPTKEITCKDFKKILQSAECPNSMKLSGMLEVWCYNDEFNGEAKDFQAYTDAIMSRPPSYILDSVSCLEGSEIDQEESEQQDTGKAAKPEEQKSQQTSRVSNPAQAVNDWIKDTFSDLDFEAIETERLTGRTPQMTEEIINQYKAEQKALYEKPGESPYRLDILDGQIQIKLPGASEWSDLKQGDKIPSGSTIFTGMDSTTVLSIRDKGVIQILSFTEVTISEEGLADPTKTTTKIELRAGEVELNLPRGAFTGSLQIQTHTSTGGVRGTHFWVKHDDKTKTTTYGVYEGTVEVKAKNGKTNLVSPNGDKPGVVVVTQKLSILKLAIAGTVLVVILGTILFFLNKRRRKTSRLKRR